MSPASPSRRLIAAHWAPSLVLALFLLAGALTLNDHEYWSDTRHQRAIGSAMLDYLAGDGERAFDQLLNPSDRHYGAAFEAPLVLLLERIIGLEGRDAILARHLLTHLFFLAGGVFCYLLVLRLFNSRTLALVATVLFLLHPRIYAHSFFNPKDVPFLVMFMISLFLVHRAFRRDTLGAFILCGVGVGLLVNLRIMGVILFAAVLALRALDLAFAGSADARRRALLTGGAFALAALLTYYASLPVLWTDPAGRFAELVRTLGAHPNPVFNLFRGELLYAPDGPPFDYVPVWVGITTPPATLLLALLGAVALTWRALRHPRHVLRNGPLRFTLLLAVLPAATVVAVVVLETNIYRDWQLLYFLYAPAVPLAAFGLWRLASVPRARWMRTGTYALAAVALVVTLVALVRIHPHQNNYFNALTERTAPEALSARYRMRDYALPATRRILSHILSDHPSVAFSVAFSFHDTRTLSRIRLLDSLPQHEQLRLSFSRDLRSAEPNLLVVTGPCDAPFPLASLAAARLYGVTLSCAVDPVDWFGGYRRAALVTVPLLRSTFDVHRVGDVLVYLRDDCSPEDLGARLFLRVHSATPVDRSPYGFVLLDFTFSGHGVRIDGDCVAVVPIPDYAIARSIARIETGPFTPEHAEDALRAVAGDEPLARSRFDVWRADGQGLVYARENCDAEDVEARFFLHVTPRHGGDLPDWRRREGHDFENLDFAFPLYGVLTEAGACIATVPLPAYPIARIETGQFDAGGVLWEARFAFTLPEIDAEALAGEPLARSVYDIHRDGEALVYVREACTDEDADAPFFLHVYPADEGDLPGHRREYGFDNLDFTLATHGGRRDGNCVAVVSLPDYAIASVRTGQYDDTGALWTAEFHLPDRE